nr:uncharacterized protein LOC106620102 isoform X1 [Bactrocera oleae]
MMSRSKATLTSITKATTIKKTKDTLSDFNPTVSYMDSLKHLSRAANDQDEEDHRKYASEEMRHFRCKEHNNCVFNCSKNKYFAFHLSDLSQKKLNIPSPPLFTEIDANNRIKIPRTVRESVHSDNKRLFQQQPNQHNLYLQYSMLAAKLLCTSTTTSETCSLTQYNATGAANSWSNFSGIGRSNSEKLDNLYLQQYDSQSANRYDNALNENTSEPPKMKKYDARFDATTLQKGNHCNDIDLGDIDSTTPLTTSMEVRGSIQNTSIDGFFNRKRGRPPNTRFVEVYPNTHQSPQAIFTSFKLEKNAAPNDSLTSINDKQIFDYDGAFRNAVKMLAIPAKVRPRFAVDPQLPMDSTTDSTVKLEKQEEKNFPRIIAENDDDFLHLNPDDEVDLKSADHKTVCEFMQKLEAKMAPVAQRHTEETTTMETSLRFMKREIEALNEEHDKPSHYRNNVILNTRDLEYRDEYIHIIPTSSQQTSVQHLKDNESVSLPSSRDNLLDYEGTKAHTFKKVPVVRTVDTIFSRCNEISSYPSNSKLYRKNCFDEATTKPGIWRTQSASCKRKCLQDDNKSMPYESIAESIEGNEFSVPQDLSVRIKKNSLTSNICGQKKENVVAYDLSISTKVDDETAVEKKSITPEEAANINGFDVELGWQNKEAIDLQLKHLLYLYQIPNQLSFETYTQLQDQHSSAIGSTFVTQADNNIFPYLSFLLAASTKCQPRLSSSIQPPTTVSGNVAQQHKVSLDFNPVSLSEPEMPTSTMTDRSTPVTAAAIAALTTAIVAQQNLLNIVELEKAATQQRNLNNCKKTTTSSTNVVSTTSARDEILSFPTSLRINDNIKKPTGYQKFLFKEDCGFENCGYRQRQSHFHCDRVDCHYSFCDKTRFVQHMARHERLDTLMGKDLQQYRHNLRCDFSTCAYQLNKGSVKTNFGINKKSHFHCLKCPFTCTDTNKVGAHRRLHNKIDYIRSSGFCEVRNTQNCAQRCAAFSVGRPDTNYTRTGDEVYERLKDTFSAATSSCIYNKKFTHFHCLLCGCGVVSRSQMSAHRQKSCNTVLTHANSATATAPVTSIITTTSVKTET